MANNALSYTGCKIFLFLNSSIIELGFPHFPLFKLPSLSSVCDFMKPQKQIR